MERNSFYEVIRSIKFFNKYCPGVTNWKHKKRGTDGNKRPISFSPEEKEMIKAAAAQLGKELQKLKL